jgi:hypothetical protein
MPLNGEGMPADVLGNCGSLRGGSDLSDQSRIKPQGDASRCRHGREDPILIAGVLIAGVDSELRLAHRVERLTAALKLTNVWYASKSNEPPKGYGITE